MAPTYTDAQVVNQIDSGAQWTTSTITFGFLQTAPSWDAGYEGDGFSPFTSQQTDATRSAIDLWDDLIVLPIDEKTSSEEYANIKFGNTNTYINYAHAYYPGNYLWAGEVWLNATTYSGLYSPDPGDYYFMTILHEIGHALGLSHPGSYNGGAPTYANDAVYAQDTHQWTVMSYFSAGNTGADWNGGTGWQYAQTPMVHDVLTIQSIYGADPTTRLGDTVYGFNSTAGFDIYDFSANPTPILTIYDAGGTDTLDLSGFSQRAVIDLRPGSYSSVGGLTSSMTNNLGIANNTWIENAVGGSGNDVLYGNSLDNELRGNGGNDQLHGDEGSDQYVGGSGTDWAYFTSAFSAYVFAVQPSYIQVINIYVDVVWDDVEWLAFANVNKSYAEIVSAFETRVIEAVGDYSLAMEYGQYKAVAADGSEVGLTYQGQPVGPLTFHGVHAIHVEEASDGGFEVIWRTPEGAYVWWLTDQNGAYQTGLAVSSSSIAAYETVFGADLNQDGHIETPQLIETDGDVDLVLVGNQYRTVAGDGTEVGLTYLGQPVGASRFPGIQAVQVEGSLSGGFEVFWRTATDSFVWWKTDVDGAYQTGLAISAAEAARFESIFTADLDEDGFITGPQILETNGDHDLVLAGNQYRAVAGDGTQVGLTYLGLPVGPDRFPGVQPVQVEESISGGFEVFWRATDGSSFWWKTDASGAYQTGLAVSPSDIAAHETVFDVDLNHDGHVEAPAVLETNGDYDLVSIGIQYHAVAADGTKVGLTYLGLPAGATRFAGVEAVEIEDSVSGGFEVLWRSSNGSFAWWKTDGDGVYQSGQAVSAADVSGYESIFETDLDLDGVISGPQVIESNGDFALALAGNQYRAVAGDGSEVGLTYLGEPVGPDRFPGVQPIQIEDSATDGFEVFWRTNEGSFVWWKTDDSGAYENGLAVEQDSASDYDGVFEVDLVASDAGTQGLSEADLWFL